MLRLLRVPSKHVGVASSILSPPVSCIGHFRPVAQLSKVRRRQVPRQPQRGAPCRVARCPRCPRWGGQVRPPAVGRKVVLMVGTIRFQDRSPPVRSDGLQSPIEFRWPPPIAMGPAVLTCLN